MMTLLDSGIRELITDLARNALWDAILTVEERIGGHWDRRRRFRVELCDLAGWSGDWDEQGRVVRIDEGLLADEEELLRTVVHEAVHMVHPEYPEDLVERMERGIAWVRAQPFSEGGGGCGRCSAGWHDLCESEGEPEESCGCAVCASWNGNPCPLPHLEDCLG